METQTVAQREPLVEAVAQLQGLNERQKDRLLVLDAICGDDHEARGHALACRLWGEVWDDALCHAFVMLGVERAKPFFSKHAFRYEQRLRDACLRFDVLRADLSEQAFASHQEALCRAYAHTWMNRCEDDLQQRDAIDLIEPVVERCLPLITLINERLASVPLHPRYQKLLVAYYLDPQQTPHKRQQKVVPCERIKDVLTPHDLEQLNQAGCLGDDFIDLMGQLTARPNAAIDHYIDALFDPASAVNTNRARTAMAIPAVVQAHADCFTERFLARLPAELARGRCLMLHTHTQDTYEFLLTHAPTPAAAAQLHLGTRITSQYVENGRLLGHPGASTQAYFETLPPPPGTLGPLMRVIIEALNTGKPVDENFQDQRFMSTLALLHQHRPSGGEKSLNAALNKSLLKLLSQKRYRQDLGYPMADGSHVMDHLPMLFTHLHTYFDRFSTSIALPASDKPSTIVSRFKELQAKIEAQMQALVEAKLKDQVQSHRPDPGQDGPDLEAL